MSAITGYAVLDYIHILLLVFWLGTDLGVLLAARRIRDPGLSPPQRLVLLEIALVIDLLPRLAFALMFAVGITLARMSGLIALPLWALTVIWTLTALWLLLTLALVASEGKPVQTLLARIQRTWLVFVAISCALGAAVLAAGQAGVTAPPWLTAKIVLFGVIALCAIGIDRAFLPLVPAMGELATIGSTPPLETRIRSAIDHALRYVYTLYACLFLAAFLGVTRINPF